MQRFDDDDMTVSSPIELYVECGTDGCIDINIPVAIEQLDNPTLRNEIIICHAQIEALHRIVSAQSACVNAKLSDAELEVKTAYLEILIAQYESEFNMLVEFDF